jgi:hypothetical protein
LKAQQKTLFLLPTPNRFLLQFKKLLPGLYHAAIDSSKYYLFTGGGTVLKVIEVGG